MNAHFYLSSGATWRTGTDIDTLLTRMKKEGFPFTVWYVPAPETAEYDIKGYAPQVEGAQQMAFYEKVGKKWMIVK